MKDIYTNTNATFTAANGETVSYQVVFDAIKASIINRRNTNGWYMGAEDIEDLIQTSILKAIRYHGSFDPTRASERTWASRIAFNAQKDALDDYNRRVMLPPSFDKDGNKVFERRLEDLWMQRKDREEEEYLNPHVNEAAGNEYSADREVEGNEAVDRIMKAIGSLNENYQFIISLQMKGMKPKKMAELIGCSAGAASTLLCRARKALMRALGKDFLAEHGIAD